MHSSRSLRSFRPLTALITLTLGLAVLGLPASRPAAAQVLDPANGHYYAIVD